MDRITNDLEAAIGPVAVLSLGQRGLLPPPGGARTAAARRDGAALADRVAGALVGAASANALGLPLEWKRRPGRPGDLPPHSRVGADVALLLRSVECMLDADLGAAPALAAWLTEAPYLRRPGNALPAVIDRLQVGVPWYEAGVGSYGNGAMVRAVAAGLVYRDRPELRPLAAACNCVVTHASVDAVAASVLVGEAVATFLAPPGDTLDAGSILSELRNRATLPAAVAVLDQVAQALQNRRPLPSRAEALPAVAAALFWALYHVDAPESAVRAALAAGGDTDTVGALVGAFAGAAHGVAALPLEWRTNLYDADTITTLATRVSGAAPSDGTVVIEQGTRGGADGDGAGVHIHFLLDRSGSMGAIANDVVGGYNQFVASQQQGTGECLLTVAQFDTGDPFELLVDGKDVRAVAPMSPREFQPRGGTPLYDAIGHLLDRAERDATTTDRDHIVVVFTDGLENASQRWTRDAIFQRIDSLKARGWTFVFLGANQDSYDAGRGFGLADGSVSNFAASPVGVARAFDSIDRASHSYRAKARPDRRSQRDDFFEGVKEAEW